MNHKCTIALIGTFGAFLLVPMFLNHGAAACIDRVDAGPAWLKGYNDGQRDSHGANGHGFDDSTHLADKQNYQSGYKAGWDAGRSGVSEPFC
jgi:hypothetical protein